MVMIGTYRGVGSRSGFLSSSIISVSTSTYRIITLISISTLTSIPKSPLGVLSVVWSRITSSVIIQVITTPIT